MDNLTHSLAGAVLGQMGLKRKSGLGMATLIIAANIPDIDAAAVLLGGHQHLAIRRGITHGPIAIVVLPLLVTAAMIWFDGWQAKRGTRPPDRLPVHRRWLFALSLIGTLSHPALDWLNNYGVRLLEPFSSRWFYGDTLFIIDIWIWIALGLGVWLSRWQEKRGAANWRKPATVSAGLTVAYIGLNFAITTLAEGWTISDAPYPEVAVASPLPVTFWKREALWRAGDAYGSLPYSLVGPPVPRTQTGENSPKTGMNDPAILAALNRDREARAFLFWSRMPIARVEKDMIILTDQRFTDPRVRDRFMVRVPLR
jgi:inner membrane protein